MAKRRRRRRGSLAALSLIEKKEKYMHPPPTQKKEEREELMLRNGLTLPFHRFRRFPSEEKRGRGLEIDDGIAAVCRQFLPLPSRILVSIMALVAGNQAA